MQPTEVPGEGANAPFERTEPLQVLFQDEHYVAVFKPAGLLVHRTPFCTPNEPILLQRLRDQLGRFLYPVHRLDRPTSGLIIFGLSSEAAKRLAFEFSERRVGKYYQAIARGWLPTEGVIDRQLKERFGESHPDYDPSCHPLQEARTAYLSQAYFEPPWPSESFPTSRYTLVELAPHTGRWHQLRRHLKHIAHPIIGDHRHGDNFHNHRFASELGVSEMLLTARRLDFRHPFSQELKTILSPLPSSFERVLELLAPYRQTTCPEVVCPTTGE
jgi:tRNA pseudouridine65 synthase